MFNIEALLEAQLQTPCQLGDGGVAVWVVGEGGHVRVGLEDKGADHVLADVSTFSTQTSLHVISLSKVFSLPFLILSLYTSLSLLYIYLSILSFSSFFTHNVSSKSSHNHVF